MRTQVPLSEAPVRCGEVAVVVHRQTEVAFRRLAGQIDGILAAPEQLDDRERQVCEACRSGIALPGQECLKRFGVRLGRQAPAPCRNEITDAFPALG